MGFWLVFFVGDPGCLRDLDGIRLLRTQTLVEVGVLPLAGQLAWMLVSQGPGNLLPLGVVVFGALSVPPIVAARIGASIAAKWARRSEP
jgi:hypothetical protein